MCPPLPLPPQIAPPGPPTQPTLPTAPPHRPSLNPPPPSLGAYGPLLLGGGGAYKSEETAPLWPIPHCGVHSQHVYGPIHWPSQSVGPNW